MPAPPPPHADYILPSVNGVRAGPYLFGAGACFLHTGVSLHTAHSLSSSLEGSGATPEKKKPPPICSAPGKRLRSNHCCDSDHKPAVKWILPVDKVEFGPKEPRRASSISTGPGTKTSRLISKCGNNNIINVLQEFRMKPAPRHTFFLYIKHNFTSYLHGFFCNKLLSIDG